ncbi:MAG TPA: nuclear transport factor 2 family protein [Methylovirgula sp.]|jgi:ketosteroid isomerase-like protein
MSEAMMIGRDEFLKKLDEAYAFRASGDREGLASILAPDMKFRIAGEEGSIPGVPQTGTAMAKIGEMIGTFHLHSVKRADAVVEGHKAAVLWNVVLTFRDGEKVNAELYDLWTIGDDGKLTSLLQFGDAALVAHVLGKA